jgi:hypothetical protein
MNLKTDITIPEIGLIAITRALLGAGVAFVVADRLDTRERKAVGWTLTGVGVLTTIPLLIDMLIKRRDDPVAAAEMIEDAGNDDEYPTGASEPVDVLDPQRGHAA